MKAARVWPIFAMFLCVAFLASAEENLISIYDQTTGWSYIDASGKVRIGGPFKKADDFSEGLGRVEIEEGKTAFLAVDGKVVFTLDVPYSATAGFSEGLAWFVRNGKMGFVDKTGKEVIPAKYVAQPTRPEDGRGEGFYPEYFKEGLVPARDVLETGWIMADGTFVKAPGNPTVSGSPIQAEFSGITPFSEGIAAWMDGSLLGLVDQNGKIIAKGTWDEVKLFSDGLASFRKGDLWGFIDKTGKEVIPPTYQEATGFMGGYATIVKGDKRGLIDKKGKEAFLATYEDLYPAFNEKENLGLWVFGVEGKRGLVDAKGKVVVQAKYDTIYGFFEGTAMVGLAGKFGLIDKTGKEVIPVKFDELGYQREGLTAFRDGQKWGFLDAKAQIAVPATWDWAGDFSGGLAVVQKENKTALVDKKGKAATAFVYDELRNLNGGRRVFKQDNKYGYLDQKGAVALAAKYDAADDVENGRAAVVEGGQVKIVDLNGKEIGSAHFSYAAKIIENEPVLVARGGKMGFIDKTGKFAIAPAYDQVISVANGVALVGVLQGEGGRWFYADLKGKALFQDQKWHPYSTFNQDRAFVLLSELPKPTDDPQNRPPMELGVVNKEGKLLTQGLKNEYGGFQENAASVQFTDGKWGFIGLDGKQLFGQSWDRAYPFSEGIGAIVKDSKFGFIDAQGKQVVEFRFDRAAPFRYGVAWVVENGIECYIDKSGKVIWKGPEPVKTPEPPKSTN